MLDSGHKAAFCTKVNTWEISGYRVISQIDREWKDLMFIASSRVEHAARDDSRTVILLHLGEEIKPQSNLFCQLYASSVAS